VLATHFQRRMRLRSSCALTILRAVNTSDTIAAITTAPGAAGISVVRVSGPASVTIADAIFRCSAPLPSGRPANSFVHGYVHSPGDGHQDVDEAILLIYRAPKSYTREDVIELQGHGGTASARRILRAALDAGARLADPGEFTRRAFLSGRIDLLQAEAVMDLIRARSDRAATAALEQLEGSLSSVFTKVYDDLIAVAGDLEATLDFGDDELPAPTYQAICVRLDKVKDELELLLAGWDEGRLLREGAIVVIAGSPNVGKSTLLNALLGESRAIVTHVAGTTRDTLEEQLILDGIPLRLVDTAGLRDALCDIEQEGIRRAHVQRSKADINLWVIDGSESITKSDSAQIAALDPTRSIVVINKVDLGTALTPDDFPGLASVVCGLRDNMGVDALRAALTEKLGTSGSAALPHAVISERHRTNIQSTLKELNDAVDLLNTEREELTAVAVSAVRMALETLGEITGRTYHAELLDNIFSRFCVGK
jgi:tRNA modification GTPase